MKGRVGSFGPDHYIIIIPAKEINTEIHLKLQEIGDKIDALEHGDETRDIRNKLFAEMHTLLVEEIK